MAATDPDVTIYHNPRCSKSRQAMSVAGDTAVAVEEVRYLETPPDADTLAEIVAKLEDPVTALIRADDARKAGLDTDDYTTADAVIALLVRHPKLMERPLLVRADKAIIGRPTERVAPFLIGD